MNLLKSEWPDSSESRQRMLESASSGVFPQFQEEDFYFRLKRCMRRVKPVIVYSLTPVLLFLMFMYKEYKEASCACCVIIMAIFWTTEIIPLAMTAMMPMFLFPLAGVLDCNATAREYFNDTNFLFIGGLIMAAAVENSNLHLRIALTVLKMVGSKPKAIMAGFMVVTAILSMFISNTATAAMMVPIGRSVIEELLKSYKQHPNPHSGTKALKDMSTGLVISICFAANIGGTGTATGTPSNLVMFGQLANLFPNNDGSLNYITWILFAVPLMIICLVLCWVTLSTFFLRDAPDEDEHITEMLHLRYTALPPMSFAEKSVSCCFGLLLFLWIGRNPGVVPGFGELFPKGHYTDSTSAILVSTLLFLLPSEMPKKITLLGPRDEADIIPRLMDWDKMDKFPWRIVILLGGGFALAGGVKDSGLSHYLAMCMSNMKDLHPYLIQAICMAVAMGITNVCSNTVTASIFVPIVATLAQEVGIHPFQLMLPTTLACSFAFILPVGTPPNAIVFGSKMLTAGDMMLVGAALTAVTLFVTILYMNTVAYLFFPLSTIPAWAIPEALNETLAL